MNLVDLATLSSELLAVSASTKVITDMIKPVINGLELKYFPEQADKIDQSAAPAIAAVVSIATAGLAGISLFEAATPLVFTFGVIGAGLIASLGSNYIHDILEAIKTVKSLKK